MSDQFVTPLVIQANATLQAVAALVAHVDGDRDGRPRLPTDWVVIRATRGFAVSWYLVPFRQLAGVTAEPFDPGRTLADALSLGTHRPMAAVQLGAEATASAPYVVLMGTRVFGLVPPVMRSRAHAGEAGTARGGGGDGRSIDPVGRVPPGSAGAADSPTDRTLLVRPPAPALRLDAAAYLNAPRRVLVDRRFVMEIGLAATPVPGVEGGRVSIDFQAQEDEVALAVHLQCEGFRSDDGVDYTLRIPRTDPFTPRLRVRLSALALAAGVDDELRAIQVTYSARGITCGIATWRLVVQRQDTPLDIPSEPPSRVAINTATPSIDLTLTSAWKDDSEATQTLCWGYSTPHAVPAPAGRLVRSSPELATLPLGIVDELAQGDCREGIELLMAGIAKRISDEVPDGVWEVLKSVTEAVRHARGDDAVPTVLILTQETRVPWELALLPVGLFPSDPAGGGALRIIGTDFIVSRWPLDDKLPSVPPHEIAARDVVAVYGDYANTNQTQLPFAKKEADYLQQQRQGIPFTATRSTVLRILLNTQTAPGGAALAPRVLHFAGHGEAARPGTPTSFIVLNDGTSLSSTYFLNAPALRQHHPLVFLNACQLGAGTESLGQPGGFAVVFVRAQCAAVVAPLWSVNDEVAYDMATHFYDAVLAPAGARVSPAAAMWQARQQRFSQITQKDPATGEPLRTATRLAYLVYGHPALTT